MKKIYYYILFLLGLLNLVLAVNAMEDYKFEEEEVRKLCLHLILQNNEYEQDSLENVMSLIDQDIKEMEAELKDNALHKKEISVQEKKDNQLRVPLVLTALKDNTSYVPVVDTTNYSYSSPFDEPKSPLFYNPIDSDSEQIFPIQQGFICCFCKESFSSFSLLLQHKCN